MSETTSVRRVAATLTIGSFSVAALMGIVALLGGGSFGEGEAKVLLTTLVVGSASICMLCYLATSGTRWSAVGVVGALVAVVPTATALLLVWQDWDGVGETTVKLFGVGVTAAVTLAQICLLLALAGDRSNLTVVLWGTVGLAALVAVMISGMILGELGADGVWRLLGIASILDVLGTLVTIALAKFGRDDVPAPVSDDRHLTVRLTPAQSLQVARLARSSGRPVEDLVGDAVAGYLAAEGVR